MRRAALVGERLHSCSESSAWSRAKGNAFRKRSMRQVQVGFLVLGLAAFVAAAFFIGKDTGLDLWRVGVAVLLFDAVLIMLWPTSPKAARAASER